MITKKDFEELSRLRSEYLEKNEELANRVVQIINLVFDFIGVKENNRDFYLYFTVVDNGYGDLFEGVSGDRLDYTCESSSPYKNLNGKLLTITDTFYCDFLSSMPLAYLFMTDEQINDELKILADNAKEIKKKDNEKKELAKERKKRIFAQKEAVISKLSEEDRKILGV